MAGCIRKTPRLHDQSQFADCLELGTMALMAVVLSPVLLFLLVLAGIGWCIRQAMKLAGCGNQ